LAARRAWDGPMKQKTKKEGPLAPLGEPVRLPDLCGEP